jgi:drug/metabolite transporter (DMT)-like permease
MPGATFCRRREGKLVEVVRVRAVVAALVAALLFGASTPASKLLLGNAGPLTIAAVLYLGAALAALPMALRGRIRVLTARGTTRLLATVILGGGVGPVLMLIGLARTGASSVALWLTLETVATAVIARVWFKEHLGSTGWNAVALVTLGSAVIAVPGGAAAREAAAFVGLACICWAIDNNLTSVIDDLSPAQIAFAKGLVAGATNLALGLWLEPQPSFSTAGAGLLVGALGYGVSLVLYVGAAQQLGATRSQLLFSTAPLWGAAAAWVFAIDVVGWAHAAGGALMILGLYLMGRERHAHEHTHAEVVHAHAHRHDDGHHGHVHRGLPAQTWHSHEHAHEKVRHTHPHAPDLHHRHRH